MMIGHVPQFTTMPQDGQDCVALISTNTELKIQKIHIKTIWIALPFEIQRQDIQNQKDTNITKVMTAFIQTNTKKREGHYLSRGEKNIRDEVAPPQELG